MRNPAHAVHAPNESRGVSPDAWAGVAVTVAAGSGPAVTVTAGCDAAVHAESEMPTRAAAPMARRRRPITLRCYGHNLA